MEDEAARDVLARTDKGAGDGHVIEANVFGIQPANAVTRGAAGRDRVATVGAARTVARVAGAIRTRAVIRVLVSCDVELPFVLGVDAR